MERLGKWTLSIGALAMCAGIVSKCGKDTYYPLREELDANIQAGLERGKDLERHSTSDDVIVCEQTHNKICDNLNRDTVEFLHAVKKDPEVFSAIRPYSGNHSDLYDDLGMRECIKSVVDDINKCLENSDKISK
jgi:hypothetical protein